jgi:hypothetical protein
MSNLWFTCILALVAVGVVGVVVVAVVFPDID